jgi:hypothetical protein
VLGRVSPTRKMAGITVGARSDVMFGGWHFNETSRPYTDGTAHNALFKFLSFSSGEAERSGYRAYQPQWRRCFVSTGRRDLSAVCVIPGPSVPRPSPFILFRHPYEDAHIGESEPPLMPDMCVSRELNHTFYDCIIKKFGCTAYCQ